MSDGNETSLIVAELRLLREQQWTMHREVVGQIRQTNDRLDGLNGRVDHLTGRVDHLTARVDHLTGRVDHLTERVDHLSVRMDGVERGLDALARYTVEGFAQVVERSNHLEQAFTRFVELSLEERRRVWPEIDALKARVDALERDS